VEREGGKRKRGKKGDILLTLQASLPRGEGGGKRKIVPFHEKRKKKEGAFASGWC